MAKTRTPRESWVEAGLEALAAGGPDAVRVEALAKALGVTKGGFYWHFDDRGALLDEILDVWERTSVDDVVERVDAEGGDPAARFDKLIELGTRHPEILRTDLAVRDWARRDTTVAARLRALDNRRMDYMRDIFYGLCGDSDEAEVRALIVFSLWIGGNFIAADHGERTREQVIEMALERLRRPAVL